VDAVELVLAFPAVWWRWHWCLQLWRQCIGDSGDSIFIHWC